MKIEDIIALSGAGFTKDDIIKLAGVVACTGSDSDTNTGTGTGTGTSSGTGSDSE